MTLGEILAEIQRIQPLAEEDVENGAVETLNARRGRKNQSIEALSNLKLAYTNELRSTALFVVVIGDKQKEFVELATNKGKCFVTDPDEYFSTLVDRIPTALYLGKESVANVFDIVGRHIEDMAHDLGIIGYPQLIFRQEYQRSLSNREQFLHLIKLAVVNQLGGEIVGIQAAKSLTEMAINKGCTARAVPILLPTNNERFGLTIARDLERISTRVFVVVAGQTTEGVTLTSAVKVPEVTKEEVNKALKHLDKSLRR